MKILLSLGLVIGCQDTQVPPNLTEFLETEITIEPPFKGIYMGEKEDIVAIFNYGVLADSVRIYTPNGNMTKPFVHSEQRLEVTMSRSSSVQGIPLNFLIQDGQLLCTTCGMYNLDMRWKKISYAALPQHYDLRQEDDIHGPKANR